jgi:hypothetical protein
VPHLFDVAPDADPSALQPDAGGIGAPLYVMVKAKGETDVRLLVGDGEQHMALATDLAKNLRCDVYLTPTGADVRYTRESSFMTSDFWDVVAIDRETGEPSRWLVVRPPDLPAGVPTWFVSTRGRLRQSNGLVTVTLPDGLAFATRATFRDTAQLAARMRAGTCRLTTVAVHAGSGKFEISRFDAASAQLGGGEFGTLVTACLDVLHPDMQLALTWPTDPADCATLDEELMRLADALDRTIWVPQPQGAAFVLPGCGEFAAVDEVGGPSSWRAYPAKRAIDWQPRYGSDLDGRLVPLGDAAATAFPGPEPAAGLFTVDLAVLADGRLGVVTQTGHELTVGPRELRKLLRHHGWTGEDLLLLAQVSTERWATTIRHLRSVVDVLGVDIWLPAPGAETWVAPDETIAADGWRVVGYGRADDEPVDDTELPSALTRVRRPWFSESSAGIPPSPPTLLRATLFGPANERPAAPAEATTATEAAPAVDVTPVDVTPVDVTPVDVTPVDVTPVDTAATTEIPPAVEMPPIAEAPPEDEPIGAGGHGITWLPATPSVNVRPIDVYVWTPLAADQMEAWALPSADLFLLAGQDPLKLADRRRTGYLLRVHVPTERAVELLDHLTDAPAALRQRLRETGGTHLLPLVWLAELRVTARFDLDGQGGVTARRAVDAGALAIRFDGAEHGVPGLPNDVVRWPGKGQRADARAYLTVPEGIGSHRRLVHRGYLALSRVKPELEEGHRVIEVKVRQRRAVDVPATLDGLGGLPVAGRLHDFVGLDLLLPEEDFDLAVAAKAWRYGPKGKPTTDKLGMPLSELLATDGFDRDQPSVARIGG